jgi:hypothetical protein
MTPDTLPKTSVSSLLGFRTGPSGTHAARTMMLADLATLFEHTPADAAREDYAAAVVTRNVLGKPSRKARELALKHLRALYGLDPETPIFRALRRLWPVSLESQPLLALTAALARDPLLRGTFPFVEGKPLGTPVDRPQMEEYLARLLPDRLSPASRKSTAQNILATWTWAGFFTPGRHRVRSAPPASPEAVALALFLGYLEGCTGERLFSTAWMKLHRDAPVAADTLARQAAHKGLLVYLSAGGVTEVRFPGYLTPDEERRVLEAADVQA